MFKILGYDADNFAWVCVSKRNGYEQGRLAYRETLSQRAFQCVALVQVRITVSQGETEIEVLDSDAPNAKNLPQLEAFRNAATGR